MLLSDDEAKADSTGVADSWHNGLSPLALE
jgi:hypothetical protein